MKKIILIIAIVFSGMLMQAQDSLGKLDKQTKFKNLCHLGDHTHIDVNTSRYGNKIVLGVRIEDNDGMYAESGSVLNIITVDGDTLTLLSNNEAFSTMANVMPRTSGFSGTTIVNFITLTFELTDENIDFLQNELISKVKVQTETKKITMPVTSRRNWVIANRIEKII